MLQVLHSTRIYCVLSTCLGSQEGTQYKDPYLLGAYILVRRWRRKKMYKIKRMVDTVVVFKEEKVEQGKR